jgi:hypothetical protein
MHFKRILPVFSLLIAYSSFAQTKASKKEADFVIACKDIVEGIYRKNISKLNKYIHPVYGLYKIY